MTAGRATTHLLAVALSLCVTGSAVVAGWMPGASLQIGLVAASAIATLLLARVRLIPIPILLSAWALAGGLAAWSAAGPFITAEHPRDPRSPALIGVWVARLRSGEAAIDPGLFRFDYLLILWLGGGWLTWCVERWRAVLPGLPPVVIGFSVTLLNLPAGQGRFVVAFLVLISALLLWASAERLPGQWRPGLVSAGATIAMAAVLAGSLIPPLTTSDTSGEVQNSAFSTWAQLLERVGAGSQLAPGASGSVGFSTSVSLSGPLHGGGGTVFTYTVPGGAPPDAPLYFRGVNLSRAVGGEWHYVAPRVQQGLDAQAALPYAESYANVAPYTVQVKMLHPAAADPSLIFYPGQLDSVDRPALLAADTLRFAPAGAISSIAAVSAASGSSAGEYTVRVEVPAATDQDLDNAGVDYPGWTRQYRGLGPPGAYLSSAAAARVTALARTITAGVATPYAQAKAVELYLRENFLYTLSPPAVAGGQDPITAFLFDSRKGYCQYFATAMADLLRSLGIPTRLVNGYGPGSFDPGSNSWVVRESDAHTWVESYFPGSGWIPFEPTPDGRYFSIPRALPAVAAADSPVTAPSPAASAAPAPDPGAAAATAAASATAGAGRRRTASVLVLEAVLILAALFIAVVLYLRPQNEVQIWRRSLVLARWLGVRKRPQETPLEFGLRARSEWSRGGTAMLGLAEAVTTASYSEPGTQPAACRQVKESWRQVRGHALRDLRGHLIRGGRAPKELQGVPRTG